MLSIRFMLVARPARAKRNKSLFYLHYRSRSFALLNLLRLKLFANLRNLINSAFFFRVDSFMKNIFIE